MYNGVGFTESVPQTSELILYYIVPKAMVANFVTGKLLGQALASPTVEGYQQCTKNLCLSIYVISYITDDLYQ